MRFLLLHIILLIGTAQLHAQINLVPNPSFEEADTCFENAMPPIADTSDIGRQGRYRIPYHWFRANRSPDYIKLCNSPSIFKTGLYQAPRTGSAMIGLATSSSNSEVPINLRGAKENVGVRLVKPLLKGQYFKVKFYVNLANAVSLYYGYNVYATSAIGAHFSDAKLSYDASAISLAPIVPQVINPANRYLIDTVGWDKIEGLYKAQGGEEWLILGDFGNRTQDTLVFKDSTKVTMFFTYYFIDDVSVTYFDTTNHVIDTTICRGRSFLYHKRPNWDSCIWYDGSSDSSKVFTQSGVYWVTHFYAGFTATDTIKLTITDSLPVQTYYLGYCVGDSVLLTARPAQQYIWNNSNTQQTQVVKQAATYYVTGNTLGCLTTDTFHVSEFALPTIAGLKDTVVCFDDIKKIELDAGLHNTYLWQPTGETTRTIYSTMAMLYNLTVTDTNGCKSSQQVAVNEQCNLQLYVPNAFSPNNDGVNEIFKISINPNHIKQFEVYNRWGQLIAQNQTGTWDGKDAPQGVYVIILYYTNDNGQEQRYSGNVTLMR
jgi:gliding motility-associated-like protein